MPRLWSHQRPLLERQHDRLEAHLAALIAQHRVAGAAAPEEQQQGCRRLLRQLRLHLRLEERWLRAHGLLCPGHRSGHQAALQAASEQWQRQGCEQEGRLALLESLQDWFQQHLQGPDAVAYGLADDLAKGLVPTPKPASMRFRPPLVAAAR